MERYLKCDEHLLWEICSWMPAKAVVKILSLSKPLSALLSEPSFVKRQTIRSSLDGAFFLQPAPSWRSLDKLEFHVLPIKGQSPSTSTFGIPRESVSFLEQNGRVVASSQGLVLLQCKPDKYGVDRFLICNPATRSCALLPIPNQKLKFARTGLLLECPPPTTNLETHFPSDYTITAPTYWDGERDDTTPYPPNNYGLAVYHNGKWEEGTIDLNIDGGELRVDMHVGVFRGGQLAVHYLCDSMAFGARGIPVYGEPYMVAYDIERKNVLRRFKLPEDAAGKEKGSFNLHIFKWRSSYSASETVGLVKIDETMLTVWVLEEYDQGEWRMVVKKTTVEMGVPEKEGGVVGCCIVNGSGLMFATRVVVYLYEMEGAHAGRLEAVAKHGCSQEKKATMVVLTLYANTLRPVCCGESGVVKLGDDLI